MWGGREFSQAVLAFAAGIFVCLFLIVLLSADQIPTWCDENDRRCLRDWLGSLSGWVAGIGAIIAALLTIPHLREQAAHAREQTAYLIGDSDPEFVLERNRKDGTVTLAVVNWNRRTVVIERIEYCGSSELAIWNVIPVKKCRDRTEVDIVPKKVKLNFKVYGWRDRGQRPSRRRLRLFFGRDDKPVPDAAGEPSLEVKITFRIVGQSQTRVSAKASAIDFE